MPLLIILIITAFFTVIGFVTNISQQGIGNPFVAYGLTEINFTGDHLLAFVLGCVSLCLFYIISTDFKKKYSKSKNYLISVYHFLIALFGGFLFAYVLLVCVAFLELNMLAVLTNVNPSILGIQSNIHDIARSLQSSTQAPQIIASDKDQYQEILAIASATTGTDSIYGKYLLPAIPRFFVVPIKKPEKSMLLIDNTLIVTQINPQDLQAISPIVGYLFVKQYFPEREIKKYPKVAFMDRKQYEKFRGVEIYKKIADLDEEINKLDSSIGTLSAAIKTDKTNLDTEQTLASESAVQKDRQYKGCLADGSLTLDYCKNLLNNLTNIAVSRSSETQNLTKKVNDEQQRLGQYQYDDNIFKTQRGLMQNLTASIPHESGVFEPKDVLSVVVDSTNPHVIADYFETLVHEYLHYASYVSDKKVLQDTFFEEGFTEYFARRAIKDTLNTSTNLGYPVFVKIISQIARRIPETDLEDIYFTKDQAGLEAALDREYGDGFYENNRITFVTLQYTSDPQQVLQLANTVMDKIGGNHLTEKDLLSSFSNL